eukprot:Lithocolla_globosa_v1_NODE_306_length_4583_cov_45.255300.p3 type:complete len:103 gc:universal NODE_306_length_4583_cov_45.255300:935-1243(+)
MPAIDLHGVPTRFGKGLRPISKLSKANKKAKRNKLVSRASNVINEIGLAGKLNDSSKGLYGQSVSNLTSKDMGREFHQEPNSLWFPIPEQKYSNKKLFEQKA